MVEVLWRHLVQLSMVICATLRRFQHLKNLTLFGWNSLFNSQTQCEFGSWLWYVMIICHISSLPWIGMASPPPTARIYSQCRGLDFVNYAVPSAMSDTLPNHFLEHLRTNPHILASWMGFEVGGLLSSTIFGKPHVWIGLQFGGVSRIFRAKMQDDVSV